MKNIASLNLLARKKKRVAFLPRSTSHYQFAHWAKCQVVYFSFPHLTGCGFDPPPSSYIPCCVIKNELLSWAKKNYLGHFTFCTSECLNFSKNEFQWTIFF